MNNHRDNVFSPRPFRGRRAFLETDQNREEMGGVASHAEPVSTGEVALADRVEARYVTSSNHTQSQFHCANSLQHHQERLAAFSLKALNLHAVLPLMSLARPNLSTADSSSNASPKHTTTYLFVSNSTDDPNRRGKKPPTQE
jgi:hypothetical protein